MEHLTPENAAYLGSTLYALSQIAAATGHPEVGIIGRVLKVLFANWGKTSNKD